MIKRNTGVYYLTQIAHSLIFTIPIWVVFYQRLFTPVQISILAVVSYAAQMAMELPSGALADIFGRKRIVAISYLIGALAFVIYPLGGEFWHFLILAILIGLSDSFKSGAEEALIYDTFVEEHSHAFEKVYAKGNMLYQMGLISATLVGGILYQHNIGLPFLLYGISLLVGFIITLLYIEPNIDSEKFTVRNYIKQIKLGFREIFRDKITTYTSLFYIVIGGITWSNALYLGAYFMVGLGFGDAERGLIQGGTRLLNALIFTFLLQKANLSEKLKIMIFPIFMIISFLPGSLANGWFGVPLFAIALFTTTGRWILLSPITNKQFSSKVRATAISALSLLIGIIYLSIVGISGPVIEHHGIGLMYTILGFLSIFTALPLGIMLLKVRKESLP